MSSTGQVDGTPPDTAAHVHVVRLLRQQTRATTYTTRDGKKWRDLERLIQRNTLQHSAGCYGNRPDGQKHKMGDMSRILCALQGVARAVLTGII